MSRPAEPGSPPRVLCVVGWGSRARRRCPSEAEPAHLVSVCGAASLASSEQHLHAKLKLPGGSDGPRDLSCPVPFAHSAGAEGTDDLVNAEPRRWRHHPAAEE
jgi:hypothetical protein